MIKKVAKNSKTSGKVYLPVNWVGKEVTVTLNGENVPAKEVFHEKVPNTTTEQEKKISLDSSKLNLDDLACRPNPNFCGRDGSAVSNDICNLCPNPVCKYFYEKKNLCNKENRYVKCKGNLRNCTIKQTVGKDIEK